MAIFLSDSFTEAVTTVLSSHTPETGSTWIEHGSYADNLNVDGDSDSVAGLSGADVGLYYNDAAPAGADYSVTGNIFVVDNAVASYPGVVGRVATGANTMYRAIYRQDATIWRLEKMVAGVLTTLGTDFSQVLTNSQTYALKLEMIGTAIKVYIDGVERISVTDSAISAAGKAGVLQYSANAQQVTSITAEDIASGPPAVIRFNNRGLRPRIFAPGLAR